MGELQEDERVWMGGSGDGEELGEELWKEGKEWGGEWELGVLGEVGESVLRRKKESVRGRRLEKVESGDTFS